MLAVQHVLHHHTKLKEIDPEMVSGIGFRNLKIAVATDSKEFLSQQFQHRTDSKEIVIHLSRIGYDAHLLILHNFRG